MTAGAGGRSSARPPVPSLALLAPTGLPDRARTSLWETCIPWLVQSHESRTLYNCLELAFCLPVLYSDDFLSLFV